MSSFRCRLSEVMCLADGPFHIRTRLLIAEADTPSQLSTAHTLFLDEHFWQSPQGGIKLWTPSLIIRVYATGWEQSSEEPVAHVHDCRPPHQSRSSDSGHSGLRVDVHGCRRLQRFLDQFQQKRLPIVNRILWRPLTCRLFTGACFWPPHPLLWCVLPPPSDQHTQHTGRA